jgi:hypothetical protein
MKDVLPLTRTCVFFVFYPSMYMCFIIHTYTHCRAGYITIKDSTAPYVKERWLGTLLVFFIYCLRVFLINGWYIVTYGIIFHISILAYNIITFVAATCSHTVLHYIYYAILHHIISLGTVSPIVHYSHTSSYAMS